MLLHVQRACDTGILTLRVATVIVRVRASRVRTPSTHILAWTASLYVTYDCV